MKTAWEHMAKIAAKQKTMKIKSENIVEMKKRMAATGGGSFWSHWNYWRYWSCVGDIVGGDRLALPQFYSGS